MSKPPALRCCQACRKIEPKKELLRLVRLPDGEIVFDDPMAEKPRVKCPNGRSYSFHRECAKKALVPGKVAHFLKVEGNRNLEDLLDQMKKMSPSL
ncbi:MAG: YlxR family protein [Patescibacteria group bacterium]|nr:YlxR family protein [Patescibacteria group bacterium]